MPTFYCMHCNNTKSIIEEKEVKINRSLSVYLCKNCASTMNEAKMVKWREILNGSSDYSSNRSFLSDSSVVESKIS